MAALVTAWAASTGAPAIGVVGPRALADRLGCDLRVRRLVPGDAPVGEVDAVLLARSAVAAGGSWAAALRPVGFDRGVALAAVLADARTADVPVVLLEDLPEASRDGWDTMLDGAVDEAWTLGPLGAGGVCWHPGEHWDATALRLAVARPAGAAGDPVVVTAVGARGAWRAAQQQGAARGRVDVDPADPWSRHLATELVGLGADVRDVATGAPVPRDGATPAAAAAWLCDRLGLPTPRGADAPQDADAPRGADVLPGADVPQRGVLLRGEPVDARESTACLAALDRACAPDGLVVRVGTTVAATPDVAAAVTGAEGLPGAAALDLGALA